MNCRTATLAVIDVAGDMVALGVILTADRTNYYLRYASNAEAGKLTGVKSSFGLDVYDLETYDLGRAAIFILAKSRRPTYYPARVF